MEKLLKILEISQIVLLVLAVSIPLVVIFAAAQ